MRDQPLRVLHVVSAATMTGAADPALQLAATQRAHLGLDARIAFDRVRDDGNLEEKTAVYGVPVVDGLSLYQRSGPFRIVRDLWRFGDVQEGFDIVHAHSSHDHLLAVVARSKAIRLIRSIHHPRNLPRRAEQVFTFHRTDGFVVITESHRDALLAAYPEIDPSRVVVARGAVDPARFRPELDGAPLRSEQGLPTDAIVFGIVARIKPGRKHEQLLTAFANARQRCGEGGPDLRLVLIGKGEGRPDLEQLVQREGLGDLVRFYGFRDADLPEAYRSLDASVLLEEGNDASCRAVLESMACGVPVIGARHPAIVDALSKGGGDLVDIDDEPGLVDALVVMAKCSREERAEMGRRGRARVLEGFTNERRADAVQALYERILEGGR